MSEEQMKALCDAVLYGKGYMLGDQHLPLAQINVGRHTRHEDRRSHASHDSDTSPDKQGKANLVDKSDG
jgi:hypothetical protein